MIGVFVSRDAVIPIVRKALEFDNVSREMSIDLMGNELIVVVSDDARGRLRPPLWTLEWCGGLVVFGDRGASASCSTPCSTSRPPSQWRTCWLHAKRFNGIV